MHVKLRGLASTLETELYKFYDKGNRAAGTRARALCQEVKDLMIDIRKDIQAVKTATKESK